jgi:hypothetical protein
VEVWATLEGAKAAAEAIREARISFMLRLVFRVKL